MISKKGFTLVELLVVIAIIGILAAIAVPQISGYIARANRTKALTDIKAIDTALATMLAATGKKHFGHLFTDASRYALGQLIEPVEFLSLDDPVLLEQFNAAQRVYTQIFYQLLRRGKEVDFTVRELQPDGSFASAYEMVFDATGEDVILDLTAQARSKLGVGLLPDIGKDPYGNLYQFFAGPWRVRSSGPPTFFNTRMPIAFRIRQVDLEVPGVEVDDASNFGDGYPAPRDLPTYIYSMGADLNSSQLYSRWYQDTIMTLDPTDPVDVEDDFFNYKGGGDDINNWDSNATWYTE